ncbi:hypothetical protein FB451DRAFT_1452593 [Mycena latifolia]|nr:hypothetical protein FB451DRAFT_1452593 [Mycena latifolia]
MHAGQSGESLPSCRSALSAHSPEVLPHPRANAWEELRAHRSLYFGFLLTKASGRAAMLASIALAQRFLVTLSSGGALACTLSSGSPTPGVRHAFSPSFVPQASAALKGRLCIQMSDACTHCEVCVHCTAAPVVRSSTPSASSRANQSGTLHPPSSKTMQSRIIASLCDMRCGLNARARERERRCTGTYDVPSTQRMRLLMHMDMSLANATLLRGRIAVCAACVLSVLWPPRWPSSTHKLPLGRAS